MYLTVILICTHLETISYNKIKDLSGVLFLIQRVHDVR